MDHALAVGLIIGGVVGFLVGAGTMEARLAWRVANDHTRYARGLTGRAGRWVILAVFATAVAAALLAR